MSRYGFGSNVHTLSGTIGSPGGSSRRTMRSTNTFDDIQTQIIRGNQVRITIDDPNMTHPINGNTLLHEAIQAQNIHFVNYLIEHGADPNVLNKYGENAYTIAYRVNNQSIIKKIKDIETKDAQEYKEKAVGWEREAGRLKRKCDDQSSDIERYQKTIKQQDLTIDRLEGQNMKLKKDNAKLKTSVGKLMKLTKK